MRDSGMVKTKSDAFKKIVLVLPVLFLFVHELGNGPVSAQPADDNVQWIEQWSQARRLLDERYAARGFTPFFSSVIKAGDAPQKISVNIEGLDTLYLIISVGFDDYERDHGVWGEAALIDKNGTKTHLGDIQPIRIKTGWGDLYTNENYTHKSLTIAGLEFEYGLLAHAHSELVYAVDRKYVRFDAWIGVEQEAGEKGDVNFKVLGHSEEKYWKQFKNKYPSGPGNAHIDISQNERDLWLYNAHSVYLEKELIQRVIQAINRDVPVLQKKFDLLLREKPAVHDARWLQLYARACRLRAAVKQIDEMKLESLKLAILDLTHNFPGQYKNGPGFLLELDTLSKIKSDLTAKIVGTDYNDTGEITAIFSKYYTLKQKALRQNPLLLEHPILFTVRRQFKKDHHNTATIFQTNEVNTASFEGGGALKTIDFSKDRKITTLLKTAEGIIRDPEVHYNGNKIIFSMRKNISEDYDIYEIDSDGTNLKQLTSLPGVADIDPVYLPDNSIVFSSTREPKYCMCNIHIMANLFRMESDGANIYQIGKSTLFEGHSSILPDGRILYDRWEYVDRNFGDAQGLWTVNADGTNHAIYWGNNTNSPGGVIDARIIPGTDKVIAVLGSCHDRPWGALGIIDRRLGLDGKEPIVKTWPENAINLVGIGDFDTFIQVQPKYEDPFPLNEKYFLCSRMTGDAEQMGIYLIDVFGNEVRLHSEAPGCYDPMPLAPHPREMISPKRRIFTNDTGTFYVLNVYNGTHMAGVEKGAVKYLRIVESPEKRFWTEPAWGGQGVHRPALNWHSFENKRIIGTVPVEADGSAHFKVPSEKFIYFQLLDENGMMIQSMRSGTIIQPGETQGCIGCHDNRRTAPPVHAEMPMALQREPSEPRDWYGKQRNFSYTKEVQPVFNKHCVSCHDFNKDAGKKLVLAADKNMFFNASYIELWMKQYINCIGAGPHNIQPAYSWGASNSKLVRVIQSGHYNVNLTKEEMDRIVTWIDLNGVYYPEYASVYPNNLAGRSPLNDGQVKRLGELTGIDFKALAGHRRTMGPQISFDRPELSPCLERLSQNAGSEYQEALQIINDGRIMLHKNPRVDMPGYIMCTTDQNRQKKYDDLRKLEHLNRVSIQKGEKKYDTN